MTRARETSRLQVATNLDGISGADEFTVVDTSVKLIDSNLTLNAGSSDALITCLLYTSPSPRDLSTSRMPSSA